MIFVLILTACGNKSIVKTEYIYPSITIPEEPSYYEVKWKKIDNNYCIDSENAKFLLKNYLIITTYKEELKNILFNLKNMSGGKNGTSNY